MSAQTLIARYEVQSRLGRGGMGSVFLARDPKLGRLVAIKLLNADLDRDDLRLRFDREARSAGALDHNNIIRIYDYGVHDDAPYIVMEYIRGETLAELIRRRAQLPIQYKVGLIDQLCHGLDYAHDTGIIHRDIKPANLMVDHLGVLKILDFGIARLAESGLTQMSVSMGTPGYMSPEQIQGHQVERPSDMFAVGAVAYELFTYRPAFSGDTLHAIQQSVLNQTPAPIQEFVPDIDPRLVAVVERAMRKSASERYPTAQSLLQDLQAFVTPISPLPRTPVPPTPVPPRPGGSGETVTRPADFATPDGQVATLLINARQAFASGQSDRTLFLVDRILAAEPKQPEALDLQQRVQDARVASLLDKARAGIDSQRFTEAAEYVAQALKIRPRLEEALQLRAEVDNLRLDTERQATNRARAKVAIDRGKNYLDDQAWEAARRSFDEALALDPGNAEAQALREQATSTTPGEKTRIRSDAIRRSPAPLPPSGPVQASRSVTPAPVRYTPVNAEVPAPTRSRRPLIIGLGLAGVVAAVVAAIVLWPEKPPPPPPPPPAAPQVTILLPQSGSEVKGLVDIKVESTASDGVDSVQLKVDDKLLEQARTTPPYAWQWETRNGKETDGPHRIDVESRGRSGAIGRASMSVTVHNKPLVTDRPTGGDGPSTVKEKDADQVRKDAIAKGERMLAAGDCRGALAAANDALADKRLKDNQDLKNLREDVLTTITNDPGKCKGGSE